MERHDVLAHMVWCDQRWPEFKPTDATIEAFYGALRFVQSYWAEKAFERAYADPVPPTADLVARYARQLQAEAGETVPDCIACDSTGFRYVDDRHVTPCGCLHGERVSHGAVFAQEIS